MSANPRGESALRFAIVLIVIDTIAVMLRLLSRLKSNGSLATDDWVLVAALIPAYIMQIFAGLAISRAGLGSHMEMLTPSQISSLLKLVIPAMISYGSTISLVKISILLMYRRIFDKPTMKRATIFVGISTVTWLFADIFSVIFLCSPINAAWDPALVFTDKCGSMQNYLLGITISNIFLDVIVLLMPLPIIWNLKLSKRRKIMLCGLFLLGGFTCIASIMRVTSIGNIQDEDFAYTFLTTYLWSHVEPSTAILCACIMTYRPLFIGFKESLQSRFSKSEGLSKGKLWNASVSDSNSNSDQSRSHTEPMQWPVGRGLRGQPDLKYQNLDRRATNDKPHAIQIPPKQQDPTPDDAEYKCATIAVGREASPV